MDCLAMQSALRPHKVAVRDLTHESEWSYLEFDRLVASCVTLLAAEGIKPGDRLACLSRNRAEIVALHLACARLGALFVPLNWRLKRAELDVLLQDCKPKLLFGDDQVAQQGLQHFAMDQLWERCAQLVPAQDQWLDPEIPSLILYTSGTTGKPKGALLSETNLAETAINFSLLGQVCADSVFLCDAPMFHVIGLVTNIRPVLLQGGCMLISDGFQPERTLERLMNPALHITHYFCVPQMARALRASKDFSADALRGLTAIFTGGAPHPETWVREWLADGLLLADGFGMSEAGTVFGMPVDASRISEKAGSVGIPTPRIRARIVSHEGIRQQPGSPGELQLQGDNICRGYWQRPEETANAWTTDGWFRTGDIASVDDDGFYRIVGRLKDMYISGGENVYPAEVESVALACGLVQDCAIVGVPDSRWGEVGLMAVVPGTHGNEHTDAILEFLKDRLAPYKIPKYVQWLESLPRNASGKVLKHVLRELHIKKAGSE